MAGTKTYAVKRYDIAVYSDDNYEPFGMMELREYGDYVAFEDYQDLHDELIDMQVELILLKNKIADLFREM